MNVHVVYISLIALAIAFIGYLKLELDSNLEKFENGKVAFSKNFVQLKEKSKEAENELNKCKKSISSLESLKKEAEEAKKKLNDVSQSSSICTQAKAGIENEVRLLKDNLNKGLAEKTNQAQQLVSCEAQKKQAAHRAEQESANVKECQAFIAKCDEEKMIHHNEHMKWQKAAEEEKASCQANGENLHKMSVDLNACQQRTNQLHNETAKLTQAIGLCHGDKQKCESDKTACLQTLERERLSKQQQQQQQQVPLQQQQQVPPQQQQQQHQQVPPQQQQQQQQQQVPPQQQQQQVPQQ